MTTPIFKENSLDLIRLLAALQVAIFHCFYYLPNPLSKSILFDVINLFPGVPIFFFISGYLISKSFEKSPNHYEYGKNRVLRIYPALIVCVLLNILMVAATGYFSTKFVDFIDPALLFIAKSTFFQFYNPDFMRDFGDGVLNGSLWTICVELQFYFLTPVIYLMLGRDRKKSNLILILLVILFLVLNRFLFILHEEHSSQNAWKIFRISFAPWIYMFLTGIFFQRNFTEISSLIMRIPLVAVLAAYVVIAITLRQFDFPLGNFISPFLFFPIAILIFRMAYSGQQFTRRLLRGNDISYGIYIWHMPIINQLMFYNFETQVWVSYLALFLSIVAAYISWVLIERPCLRLKKFNLHPHQRASN